MRRALCIAFALLLAAGCQKRVKEQPRPLAVSVKPVSPPAPPAPAPPLKDSGVWVEADAYDLKLVESKRCAGKLGLRVRVRSKVKALFIGPRDASLHDGEQRYEALRTQGLEGCKPGLPSGYVQRGKEIEGYVMFELGHEPKKPILEFSPTRWGGVGAVRVAVAD
jgi:hypothetical protein